MASAATLATLLLVLNGWVPAPAWAGKAHEHGVARLDIGVEPGRISLSLEVPLEDLTGFERAPRSDAERAAVAAALAKLSDVAQRVRIDRAGDCGAGKVALSAPVWGVPAAAAPGASDAAKEGGGERSAHADLEARYEFMCAQAPRAGHVELGFFEAFPRLRRIEVQAVTPRGQMKVVLRRPHGRVGLAR
jgi:hypothetical protein